ncbi:MAG: DUF4432 family protein [Bacteriovoracia bacterium]
MITLQNQKLLVKISTGRGARIEHFIDKETNKDWVWKPDSIPGDGTEELALEAGFDANWAGGWEEVFPNDAPAEIKTYQLKDHGEVWRKSWKREDNGKNEHEASFSFTCETYPVHVKKTFVLNAFQAEMVIDYEVKNMTSDHLPFIFKFHPALNITEGDKFIFPDSSMEPVALGFSRIIGKEGKTAFPFGEDAVGNKVSIDTVRSADGFSREFVKINELRKGNCALYNPQTRKELAFEFLKEELPYVWLFQSYGGFEGHYVAMMEPTNAGHYDLKEASEKGKCGLLCPDETVNFSLTIKLREV